MMQQLFIATLTFGILGSCSHIPENAESSEEPRSIDTIVSNPFAGYDTLPHEKIDGLYLYDLKLFSFTSPRLWYHRTDTDVDFSVTHIISDDSASLGIYSGLYPQIPGQVEMYYFNGRITAPEAETALKEHGTFTRSNGESFVQAFRLDSIDIWITREPDDHYDVEVLTYQNDNPASWNYHLFADTSESFTSKDILQIARALKR